MKKWKRLLALILTMAMVLSLLQTSVFAAETAETLDVSSAEESAVEVYDSSRAQTSGSCGANLTWSYNVDERTLTVEGSGAMYDYDERDTPWDDYDEQITTLIIKNGVTTIGHEAFEGFERLTKVTLPDSLTTIGVEAFGECERLNTITIPKKVTSVKREAFKECALSKIYFRGSAPTFGGNVFEEVTATAYYPSGDSTWTDSVRQNYGGSLTWKTWSPDGGTTDPDTPAPTPSNPNAGTCGANLTWSYNVDERTLTIEGSGAMYDYDERDTPWDDYDEQITTLVIKSGVTTIGREAFEGFERLTKVTLPDSLTTIGVEAFGECERLNTITIPKKVTSVKREAFKECEALDEIYFRGSAPTFGSNVFEDVFATAYYPSGDSTWTSDVKQNYGGRLTWKTWSPSGSTTDPDTPAPSDPVKLTAPTLSGIANTDSGIKLTWKKVSGASGYYVYRKTSDSSWTRIKTVSSGSTVSYTDKKANEGTTYTYTVRAYDANKNKSGYDKTGKTMKRLDTPDMEDASNAASSITVRWEKVKGASGYYVYRKAGSETSWTRVATVKGSNVEKWSDENATTNGTKYIYTVRAYSGSYKSNYEKDGEEIYRLSRTSISSLKNSSSKKMTVKWKKNSKASGYQVQYSTKKDFSSNKTTKTISGNSNVSKTISSLTKNKKYYVRVRSYKKVSDEKYYSAWSSVKNVTIAK